MLVEFGQWNLKFSVISDTRIELEFGDSFDQNKYPLELLCSKH